MASTTTQTKWIVTGAVLALVSLLAVVILVVAVRSGDDGTSEVTTSTSTTSTSSTTSTTTTVAGGAPAEPDDIVVERVTVPGTPLERSYTVIRPMAVPASERLPTVMVLHGLGVNAQSMSRAADWRGAVAEHEFVAVFPQGLADSWNMGPCCPPASLVGTKDSAFLDTVVDELLDRPDVNAERLYLTGFSNGAIMVYPYACDHPGRFAAIAPMAGSNITGCTPDQPLSLLHQHSDPDLVVPYDGGLALGQLLSRVPFPAVPGSVAEWAAADGCAAEPTVRTAPDGVERSEWTGCSDGTRVELIKIPAVGHVWPRTGTYDGLDELLRFFDLT